MTDWPHQTYGVNEVAQQIALGHRRLCLSSPTGGGKTRMMQRLIEWGRPIVVYVNRKLLIEQLSRALSDEGIRHGIMASGYAQDISPDVQLASVQTVEKRWSAGKMHLHPAEIVCVDECHNEKGKRMRSVIDAHLDQGASVVGITATPVGVGGIYRKLIQAGTVSDLRKCGALVPAVTYAPDEMSAAAYKPRAAAILSLKDEVKKRVLPTVFGRVVEHYRKLNPEGRPSLLFAPGVDESRWFARLLYDNGITAAHIDGVKIWINGEWMPSNTANRERLRTASESGEVQIVCNRFVLREGVDWPHLSHCIMACTFGGLCSYLQAGGRMLRSFPDLDSITCQDHGGNYWRHGSLNKDREWHLSDSERKIATAAAKAKQEHPESEPIVCPRCAKVRALGVDCPGCGFVSEGRVRMVIQTDGQLVKVSGAPPRKKVSTCPDDHKRWKSVVYRCRNKGLTFRQARAIYAKENLGLFPAPDFPLMPKHYSVWDRKVSEVVFRECYANL